MASFEQRDVARGETANLTIRIPNAKGQHAVRIRATTPAGRDAEWLRQVVLVDGKGAIVAAPIAHNDPVGTWTFRAVDLFTDQAGEAKLIVR